MCDRRKEKIFCKVIAGVSQKHKQHVNRLADIFHNTFYLTCIKSFHFFLISDAVSGKSHLRSVTREQHQHKLEPQMASNGRCLFPAILFEAVKNEWMSTLKRHF